MCSYIRRLCSPEPPRILVSQPALKTESSQVTMAPLKVLPPERLAQQMQSWTSSKKAAVTYSAGGVCSGQTLARGTLRPQKESMNSSSSSWSLNPCLR